jgi:hypothetical protein
MANRPMGLFVRGCLPNDNVVTIHAYPYDRLADLKPRIQQRTGFPLDETRLIYKGRLLNRDEATLVELGLRNGSSIMVTRFVRG